ncbi:hypothetical protein EDC94DRAFT_605116 [Helicostylum pulchrum]|nr:hypothetical protein EDC94DRAFT_605116 [Helicostylum pulchrum]
MNEVCRKHYIAVEPVAMLLFLPLRSRLSPFFLKTKTSIGPFVDSVRKNLKDKMDWEAIFQIRKDIGLFQEL